MLGNWIKVALRSLWRHPTFTFINLFGLAVGLASCLLILLHVRDEASYDDWVPEAGQVYRVHSQFEIPGRTPFRTVRAAGRMKDAFLADYAPALEAGARLLNFDLTVQHDGEAFAQSINMADPAFLDIFPLALTDGRPAVMADPRGALITATAARRYFGREDVVGETLTICCIGPETMDYRIAGVLADLPRTTHLDIEVLLPMDPGLFARAPNILDTWTSVNTYTYLKLRPGASIEELRQSNGAFLDRHVSPDAADGGPASRWYTHRFVALPDLRLHSREDAGDVGDLKPMGDFALVVGLTLVAGLVLFLAAINFAGMSIARSTLRAREVAVRKVLGGSRGQVAAQFLAEAAMLAALAAVVGLGLVELVLPGFNGLVGKDLAVPYGEPSLYAALLGLVAAVAVVGGSYPALHVARFKPAPILKGETDRSLGGASGIRTVLVVVQFAIAIGLIIVTSVVFAQTLFVRQAELGFDRHGVVVMRNLGAGVTLSARSALVEEIRGLPAVREVSLSTDVPTDNQENNTGFLVEGSGQPGQTLNIIGVDHGFFGLYRVTPMAGRAFDEARADAMTLPEGDGAVGAGSVILNESAALRLGFADPRDAVGRTLASEFGDRPYRLTIIGIVPDIRFRSLKYDVQPTVYYNRPTAFDNLSLRVATDEPAVLMEQLRAIARRHVAGQAFDARYLEDMIAAQYRDESVQATVYATFTGLAILVACLGLYGLSAFAAERRTKEIGVRKVFGATVAQLIRLMVWQFSRPVLLANLLAWPVAWWFLSDWLQGFDRRIDLSPLYFLAAAGMALVVACVTVAGHAARVAVRNPVQALRYE